MKNQLLNIINTVLENNDLPTIERLDPEVSLQNDLGMDSIVLAKLSVRIEVEFVVDIFENLLVNTI